MERSYFFEYPRPWQDWVRSHSEIPRQNLSEVLVQIAVNFIGEGKRIPDEFFLRDHFIDTFEEIFLEGLDEITIAEEDKKYVSDLIHSFECIKEELFNRRGNFLKDSIKILVRHFDQYFISAPKNSIYIGDIQPRRFTLIEPEIKAVL